MNQHKQIGLWSLPVLVAALGYFVDVYDLLLFTIVRQPSVLAVGSTLETIIVDSAHIINWQMSGLLIGGILWGIIGDKKGRLKVLFGSILLYSVANILTSFVQTVDQYAYCRFVGGIGLAGELGAGITLVSEMLPKHKRGIGTSMVAGIGLFGAVFAYFTFQYTKDWRLCYQIGGGLGVFLLILRVKVAESFMFESAKLENIQKGNFFMFLNNKKRFSKYIKDLASSLPGTQSILEIGCGTGIDLRLFVEPFQVHGIDLNEHALDIAKEKLPNGNFQNGDITKLPFEDSSIDFVFTHGLMNYLEDDILEKGVAEMFRVSKKWIMHCEKYEKTEKQIDENHKFRNMGEKWIDYKIKFVSDVDLHEDYGQDQTRFTLLKKL